MLKKYILVFFANIYILKQLTKSIHLFSVTTEQATNLKRFDSECPKPANNQHQFHISL